MANEMALGATTISTPELVLLLLNKARNKVNILIIERNPLCGALKHSSVYLSE